MADTLIDALQQEHHQIDAGLEAFVHGLGSGELRRDEFTRAADALRRHIYLEEAFLFPPIRDAGLVPPILVMLREHGTIWQALDALDEDVDALERHRRRRVRRSCGRPRRRGYALPRPTRPAREPQLQRGAGDLPARGRRTLRAGEGPAARFHRTRRDA